MNNLVLKLKSAIQHYEWGKRGEESEVAKLVQSAHTDYEIKDLPYAELWMGTHPNGTSTILEPKSSSVNLSDWIAKNPQSLGAENVERFGVQLPFLLKVLSVNNALSIQAHPNKSHAEQLHSERPDIYKDPNHKPEMAIALTPFEALCGFRTIGEIRFFLKEITELRNVIGEDDVAMLERCSESDVKENLKRCFRALMTCADDVREKNLTALAEKFSTQDANENEDRLLSRLFLRVHSEFPGDVGCFGIYVFNFIRLKPGEAIFLGPNVPHAYLHGDCVECMACSDNVVRAGLTPKYKDVETLCNMLTYQCGSPEENIFKGTSLDQHITSFSPPIPDFSIVKIELPNDAKDYQLPASTSASILLFVRGSAKVRVTSSSKANISLENDIFQLTRGDTVFISAGLDVLFTSLAKQDLLVFQALSNL